LRIKKQETRLTLYKHDDDDDDNAAVKGNGPLRYEFFGVLLAE